MALDLGAVGRRIGPISRNYAWKDTILYALGVGAGFGELAYCYEKELKVLPSFAGAAIFDFFWEIAKTANVNPAGALHGEQSYIFHEAMPTQGSLTTEGMVTHIHDQGKKKGALVLAESTTCDSSGKKLFTGLSTIFARSDGGFGGKPAPKRLPFIPDGSPDAVVASTPSADQPLLYRLSGDFFQLHVDPEFARLAGFERPIMHGLCTQGFACRALISSLIPGRPEMVRRLGCRFTKPLYPGIPIETHIWRQGAGKAFWRTLNVRTAEVVIDHGIFEYTNFPDIGDRHSS